MPDGGDELKQALSLLGELLEARSLPLMDLVVCCGVGEMRPVRSGEVRASAAGGKRGESWIDC